MAARSRPWAAARRRCPARRWRWQWRENGPNRAKIDPALFVLRDMADYALDVVAPAPPRRSPRCCPMPKPTLCYRADPDEPLFARQQAVWEPLLAGVERATACGLNG
jgi:hypothetical protein